MSKIKVKGEFLDHGMLKSKSESAYDIHMVHAHGRPSTEHTSQRRKSGLAMKSPFNKDFNDKSPVKEVLTNKERRKAEKAGKAYAQSMEVGISEKKRKRKTEKSNKKIMKALGRDTYANKTMQGHVRFRSDGLSDKDREILNVSQKSVEANKKRYIDDDFHKHPDLEKNFDEIRLDKFPSKRFHEPVKFNKPDPVEFKNFIIKG
jgi:hypothetical protein